jgi:hypothetical protein
VNTPPWRLTASGVVCRVLVGFVFEQSHDGIGPVRDVVLGLLI